MTEKKNLPPGEHIKLNSNAAKSIEDYWEYTRYRKFRKFILNQIYKIKKRIVGNDDGGITFTPEEYERYKKEVLPMVNI